MSNVNNSNYLKYLKDTIDSFDQGEKEKSTALFMVDDHGLIMIIDIEGYWACTTGCFPLTIEDVKNYFADQEASITIEDYWIKILHDGEVLSKIFCSNPEKIELFAICW